MSQPAWRHIWERRALFLAFRVNASAWLEGFAPFAFGIATAGAVGLYALRRLREPLSPVLWSLLVAWLLAALLVVWLRRKSFFNRRDARVFLEFQLSLDTALSAAHAGIAAWPDPQRPMPRVLKLGSKTALAWLGFCAALLLASLWVPVPPLPRKFQAAEKSPSLVEVERLIEELKQSELVEASALERLSTEARQLGSRPLEQQYSHSALEAADQLRDQTLADTQSLAKNLEEAAKALEDAESSAPQLSDSEAKQAAEKLKASLQGMRSGQLAANEKLSSQLQGLNASQLQKMSKEQLSQMRQAMQQAGSQARGISGAKKNSQVAKGNGEKLQRGQGQGQGLGSGSPGSGGDPAPLAFNENASPDLAGKTETLTNDDYSRASLGDPLQTSSGKHEVDPTKAQGTQKAGAVSGKAQGGDAVWINRLTPAERTALKDFFK